jgi:hypothetical protein
MKLIPDWKKAWRFASMRWSALGIVLMGILEAFYQGWLQLPPAIADRLPHTSTISIILFVLVMVGRLFTALQGDDDECAEEDKR